jgi:hypothetical protein
MLRPPCKFFNFRIAIVSLMWIVGEFALATSAFGADQSQLILTFRGKQRLQSDQTTDQSGTGFTITGLSGITYRGGTQYTAVMDNSNKLVNLDIELKPDGSIATATVTGGVSVATSRDYEGIAYTNAERNSVFISNEATPPPPAVYEYSLENGKLLQTVNMPKVFMHQVDNRGLESLTRRPDGKEMWTANEEALTVDGPASSATIGSVVRLQRFTVDGNRATPTEQYAYVVEPIHSAIGLPICSGLSDLVDLPDGRLLALERSAREGLPPFETRIYLIDFASATDISQGDLADGLSGKSYKPVAKTELFKSTRIGENLEGLCIGPKLANGNWAVLGVVDNGDGLSKNTLVAFELSDPAPLPIETIAIAAGGGLLLVGVLLAAVKWTRRSRA